MYTLGLDIGTTSCKICVVSTSSSSIIFTEQLAHNANIVQKDFPSFDEQSPSKIVETIDILLEKSGCLKNDSSIKSIQVCGQMHGFILWSSKSPRTIVSPLVTWQDQRCSTEFLSSLGTSLTHLRTGYGLATLLWLIDQQKGKEDELLKYDCAGTIADYVVTILCGDSVMNSQISTQMATSWGALNNQWPIEHCLLPMIVEPGTIIGYWKNEIPVYVALGDLQCSVFSCQPENNEGVLNISTSAQLALAVDQQSSIVEDSQGDNLSSSSSIRVPYFQSKDLLVAASLNGGNILSAFVQLIYSWELSLNNLSSLSHDHLWSRLIELGLQSLSSSTTIEHFSAALFGERHDTSMSASITNIRSINLIQLNDIGLVFRSICQWIIKNLFEMLGKNALLMKSVIGTGSALMRNGVLQGELKEKVKDQVKFNEHSDAAYGAALFALMQ
jgi:sedoheptulokinase